MKKISFWAKQNPRVAVIFIVLLHIILAFLALYIGNALYKNNVILPFFTAVLALPLLAIIALKYSAYRHIYSKRKLMEFSFFVICFFAVAVLANRLNVVSPSPVYASSLGLKFSKDKKPTAGQILESLKYRDKSTLTRAEKRILKTEFKTQFKKHLFAKLSGDKEASKRTWLIILAIVAALGVTVLLGALSCSIACGGADAAAVIVGVLGLAGIIWGTTAIIRNIKRKHPRTPKAATPQ